MCSNALNLWIKQFFIIRLKYSVPLTRRYATTQQADQALGLPELFIPNNPTSLEKLFSYPFDFERIFSFRIFNSHFPGRVMSGGTSAHVCVCFKMLLHTLFQNISLQLFVLFRVLNVCTCNKTWPLVLKLYCLNAFVWIMKYTSNFKDEDVDDKGMIMIMKTMLKRIMMKGRCYRLWRRRRWRWGICIIKKRRL